MTQKNLRRLELKERRKEPMPRPHATKSLREKRISDSRKHKQSYTDWTD